MEILSYDSITESEVEKYWKMYFPHGSLMGDYDLACYIEKNIFKYSTKECKVIIFIDKNEVTGIMPLSYEVRDNQPGFWTYYPGIIFTASSLTISPNCWPYLKNTLPKPFKLEESSWLTYESSRKYIAPSFGNIKASNVIDLKKNKTFETYFENLDKKSRSIFRNCINRNSDILIEKKEPSEKDFEKISNIYLQYCSENFTSDMLCQMALFPEIFKVASKLKKLIALSFYSSSGNLVAINYGILNDNGKCFCDYICYRNTEDESLKKRSLGIFAILENIKHIYEHYPDCEWYDLASDFDYKKRFLNCEKYHIIFSLN